jgi:hypothetical protein
VLHDETCCCDACIRQRFGPETDFDRGYTAGHKPKPAYHASDCTCPKCAPKLRQTDSDEYRRGFFAGRDRERKEQRDAEARYQDGDEDHAPDSHTPIDEPHRHQPTIDESQRLPCGCYVICAGTCPQSRQEASKPLDDFDHLVRKFPR